VHCDVIFLTREFQFYLGAGLFRQNRGHQVEIVALVLVSEAPAHELADHTHAFRVKLSGRGGFRYDN